MPNVFKQISAENTFSDSVHIYEKNKFHFSLSGTWVATVHLQRKYRGNWYDVESFTSNVEKVGEPALSEDYRFGVKAGNYTSGSIEGRIIR